MSSDTNTTKKILVVEDDKEMNASLQRKFEKLGFATESAFDGEEAMKLLKEKVYDGMTLDLMMPIKDGFAVMAQMRGTPNEKTPVFVLTSIGEEGKIDLAWELGAKQVFKKEEYKPADVAEAVSNTIHSLPPR